jgi:hypothetical protein
MVTSLSFLNFTGLRDLAFAATLLGAGVEGKFPRRENSSIMSVLSPSTLLLAFFSVSCGSGWGVGFSFSIFARCSAQVEPADAGFLFFWGV